MSFNDPIGGFMFNAVPIFIMLIFVLVFGTIIFTIIKGIDTWSYNNAQPVLTVAAKLVSRRTNVSSSHHHDAGDMNHVHHSSSTTYYLTFEVESGDRMEFQVRDQEYGLLVEGDVGKLTFQGSRYHGFERSRSEQV